MVRAIFDNQVIAESDFAELIEGHYYFPEEHVRQDFLRPSDKNEENVWKGKAIYFDVVVNDKAVRNAAWSYPNPTEAAEHIAGHIAFDFSLIDIEE